jgi:hypothetical protein
MAIHAISGRTLFPGGEVVCNVLPSGFGLPLQHYIDTPLSLDVPLSPKTCEQIVNRVEVA